MLKYRRTRELVDEFIEIGLELEMYDCGNSIPPKRHTVHELKLKGYRRQKALLDNHYDGSYRGQEFYDALDFIPSITEWLDIFK